MTMPHRDETAARRAARTARRRIVLLCTCAGLLSAACMAVDIEVAARLLALGAPGPRSVAQASPTSPVAYRSQMIGIGWGQLVIGWSREDGVRPPAQGPSACAGGAT
ncbi:hypothetical protein J2W22_000077 [Sphingomonas kyeonggiensis]|uniref:hypothetical protein n=1 Tax=Sphingomonas kyeonggiensis TaxID=1268553 RepID=UPI00278257CA|nr:hypothetical protein [Sphingomonas kyeonggiensis]MDQ0248030.1 hypothetical protein [Sphingomonas kyeonggiensis]